MVSIEISFRLNLNLLMCWVIARNINNLALVTLPNNHYREIQQKSFILLL